MRVRAWRCVLRWLSVLIGLSAMNAACGGTSLFRQYEYEEEVYLSLDGSAAVYVNASIPALNALHGTSFAGNAATPPDRDAIRSYYSTPTTRVAGRVSMSRRSNRRFVHLRVDVDDINRLGTAAPFAWSVYRFERDGELFVYRQAIDGAAGNEVGPVGWSGREMVAFRLHLPSKIRYHATGREVRGNILQWEQPLADRIRGTPLTLDASMETQSILYRTLWLFGSTFLAVAACFALVIWWVLRRAPGGSPAPPGHLSST
jgi:hypothetical protein